jgi:hypothetical protein
MVGSDSLELLINHRTSFLCPPPTRAPGPTPSHPPHLPLKTVVLSLALSSFRPLASLSNPLGQYTFKLSSSCLSFFSMRQILVAQNENEVLTWFLRFLSWIALFACIIAGTYRNCYIICAHTHGMISATFCARNPE